MTFSLHGVAVSGGIAIGNAYIIVHDEFEVRDNLIEPSQIDAEVVRLHAAIDATASQLRAMREKIPANTPSDVAAFIDTYLLMLTDTTLSDEPIRMIRERRHNAAFALRNQRDAIVAVFEQMDDPYLQTRHDDVDHVVNRILRTLFRDDLTRTDENTQRMQGAILLADDLAPADALLMQHYGVLGFVTEYGGPTSHTSILARSLGVPGIVGVHHARRFVHDGEVLIIDGNEGVVIGDPDQRTLNHYRRRLDERLKYVAKLNKLKRAQCVTRDGVAIELQANVELPTDFAAAREVGASGVGLYRTEFLYMNRVDIPTEDEHFDAYKHLVETVRGVPVTIRTMDIGGDKQVDPALTNRAKGANPALGLRAIRLGLKEPQLFVPQVRAIIKASALGAVRMMIPMLSHIDEAKQVREIVRSIQQEFKSGGVAFDPGMLVGGMIEVPVAAIYADGFAQVLDFFSIGTNDLIQYAIAIDRVNDEVNYLYDPLNPGVLRLIAMTIKAGQKAKVPVAMCGEMAGDVRCTRMLLGMGLEAFSVHPAILLEIKRVISDTELQHVRSIAEKALKTTDMDRFKDLLQQLG
ncbi:MAG: phosphoenolpyruvate--protein phosphotransferase [Gammaproteobacteria bacterium]|nr:phosphoenolpyruvate--protein phosphotransferase [Gammaproteobacteria bacterium]